jgi:hypothetical protein
MQQHLYASASNVPVQNYISSGNLIVCDFGNLV